MNLLELIQVKKVVMQIMKLVEYKHLLSKFKNRQLRKLEKASNKKMIELEDEIKKLKL